MLGKDVVYDHPHWFWSDQYDHNLQLGSSWPAPSPNEQPSPTRTRTSASSFGGGDSRPDHVGVSAGPSSGAKSTASLASESDSPGWGPPAMA